MIITCPNCAARYRIDVAVVERRSRLKCAACGHRWVPAEPVDEDEAVAAVQASVRAAAQPAEPAAAVADEPAPDDVATLPPRQRGLWKWLVAVPLGAALSIAAAGLWAPRLAPAAGLVSIEHVPCVGPALANALAGVLPAPAPPLAVTMVAQVSPLPGGGRLLEVTGLVRNPGGAGVAMPAMTARLVRDGRTLRRWTIPPPVARLAANGSTVFASSITDVPPGPVTVQLRIVP